MKFPKMKDMLGWSVLLYEKSSFLLKKWFATKIYVFLGNFSAQNEAKIILSMIDP